VHEITAHEINVHEINMKEIDRRLVSPCTLWSLHAFGSLQAFLEWFQPSMLPESNTARQRLGPPRRPHEGAAAHDLVNCGRSFGSVQAQLAGAEPSKACWLACREVARSFRIM
jgi:hypothetical protein